MSTLETACRARARRWSARSAATALVISLAAGLTCGGADDPLEPIRELQREGRVDESVLRLRALLEENPDQPEIQLFYGRTLVHLGELSLAIWPLRRAASEPALAVEAGLLLAHALLRIGSAEDGIRALNQVLAADPKNATALELRIGALLEANREEEALEDIERLQALDPDHLSSALSKTVALLALERVEEAGESLRAVKERVAADPEAATPAMHARLCLAEATFTAEKGEPERAEDLLEACLDEYPADPLVVNESVELYERAGNVTRALEILRRAFEEAPEESSFREALASRLRASSEIEEAERLLLEATQGEAPLDGWIGLYRHYTALEDYAAARAAMERVFEHLESPSPLLRLAYGDTLVMVEEYERALAVADELPPAHAKLLRGRCYLAQGDAMRAHEALVAGVRLWPNNATGRWLAGQAAERVGEFEEALSHYREAVRADAARTDAALRGARLYAATGRDAEALDFATRYVRSHPNEPEGYLFLLRIADRANHEEALRLALTGLARLPGQAGRALAEQAALLAASAGPARAAAHIERAGLDLDDPENAAALAAWAEYVCAARETERALARVEATLADHPESAALHRVRAQVLGAAGRPPEDVRAALEHSVALDPQDPQTVTALARLLVEQGEVERALALYDGIDDDAEAAYAAVQLLVDLERLDQAERRLASLLEIHPTHARAANDLARLLVERGGNLDRAESLARRAVLFGLESEALETLGRIELARLDEADAGRP